MDFVKKGKKVTVIGAGNVGASIAFTLAIKGLCSELLLVDINKPKAKGEAMDIMQGTAFCPAVDVRDGDYADAVNSDLVIITVGIARKPGQTRIDLFKTNAKIMASVMPEITKYAPNACYIIVSNPVDVLTYEAIQVSGLNPKHVYGSGLFSSADMSGRSRKPEHQEYSCLCIWRTRRFFYDSVVAVFYRWYEVR